MQMTKQLVKRLRSVIAEKEFCQNEVRRIIGLGEQYIALSSTVVTGDDLVRMMRVNIDGVSYTIYAKSA